MTLDVEYFEEHYAMNHPDLTEHMWPVVDHLRAVCPVARSDAPPELGGVPGTSWVVTSYDEVIGVLQDWGTFSSDYQRHVDAGSMRARFGPMPPINMDPPVQRDFRQVLNPYLSQQVVARHELTVRRIVAELIDAFIEDGRCDVYAQLANLHPPRMLYEAVFGIDDAEQLARNRRFMQQISSPTDVASAQAAMDGWTAWILEFVEERRAGPRREDIIDGLLHGTVEGRPITDAEVVGAIRILILGGFSTTTDAITSTMMLLLEHPDLFEQLRVDRDLLPTVIEEALRLEPPVISLFRICTRDTVIHDQKVERGDAVLTHFGGANRDPAHFDDPADLRVDRAANRHLTFGAGAHRCIGSHVARLNLRVIFDEILTRLHDVRIADGERPRRAPASMSRGWSYVPISFTPGRRVL